MVDADSTESPIDAAAGEVADQEATEAFDLLANELRLAILLALWDAYEPFGEGGGLSFSELRERVGRPDSGNFNYHVGKLTGRFIRSTDEGYRLRPAGEKTVRAVIAGSGLETPTLEPSEIGMPCPLCDAPTAVTYRDGRLFQVCTECEGNIDETRDLPEGTLYTWRLEPAGLVDRSPEEAYAAAATGMLHRAAALADGVCPECSGPVEAALELCEDHETGGGDVCPNCGRRDEVLALYQCAVCKFSGGAAPSDLVSHHPAVVAFYHDHGVDVQYGLDSEGVRRVVELEAAHRQTLESTDPVRVRVTVGYEGDELDLILDGEMQVVETERRESGSVGGE